MKGWIKTINPIIGCIIVGLVLTGTINAGFTLRRASGANAAALQTGINQFKTDLGGVDNGTGGHSTTGRREINWDDVPHTSAQPNFMEPNFFNTVFPRGLVLNTIEYETGAGHNDFMVSAATGNPTNTPVEFGNINTLYPAQFLPFSGQRIMAARGTSMMELLFFIPGTNIPATVKGFGAVFLDPDSIVNGQRSAIRCYDKDGSQIAAASTDVFNGGLVFLGITFTNGDQAARCTIEAGNIRLQSDINESGAHDIVALDDFIYGEPQAADYHQGDFDGDGSTDLSVFRPQTGEWFILHSGTNTIQQTVFGQLGDRPIHGDFDGDGRGDLAVFRPTTGEWFRQLPSGFFVDVLGQDGDEPVPGDYDKDGKTDLAVWRKSDGTYLIANSSGGTASAVWGQTGDIPISGAAD